MNIPFVSFENTNREIKKEILDTFEQFFDSSYYVLGNGVKRFEEEYGVFNKVKHVIGVSNGLDALYLSLKALGVGKGDEVLIPSHTFIATALAVSNVGATPVFVEPNSSTMNIDVQKINESITAKTKAIIPVHLYGQACEMDSVVRIAKSNNLFIIEDNAQAQGATSNGQLTGSFGQVNATSFYPGKNLGALGDAGAITTNSDELAKEVQLLRNYGSVRKYHHESLGFNMRLDEAQAFFLSVKLRHLEKWTNQRIEIAGWYNELLKGIDQLQLPLVAEKSTHVFHLYVVRAKQRDALQKFLGEKNIGTLIHYPIPPHLQKAYAQLNYRMGSFPIAEEIAEKALSLPLWPGMTQSMVEYVCDNIKEFYE